MNFFSYVKRKRLLLSLPGLVLVISLASSLMVLLNAPLAHASCLDEQTPCAWVAYHKLGSDSLGIAWWYGSTGLNPQPMSSNYYQIRWFLDGAAAGQARIDSNNATGTYTIPHINLANGVVTFQIRACNTGSERCTNWSDKASYQEQSGSDTCAENYYWRNAYPGDHVCVSVWSYYRAILENNHAGSHESPAGSGHCVAGYVWRMAGPNDHVCVTVVARAQTAYDNHQAFMHMIILNAKH